jgi:predicted nucleic acid-binding protein
VIFVDTGFFFAFFSETDRNHARAVEVFQEFEGRRLPDVLLTTDHVVFETITLTRYRISHERAVFVGERLYSEKMARIHASTSNAPPSATSSGMPTRSTAQSTASASR